MIGSMLEGKILGFLAVLPAKSLLIYSLVPVPGNMIESPRLFFEPILSS